MWRAQRSSSLRIEFLAAFPTTCLSFPLSTTSTTFNTDFTLRRPPRRLIRPLNVKLACAFPLEAARALFLDALLLETGLPLFRPFGPGAGSVNERLNERPPVTVTETDPTFTKVLTGEDGCTKRGDRITDLNRFLHNERVHFFLLFGDTIMKRFGHWVAFRQWSALTQLRRAPQRVAAHHRRLSQRAQTARVLEQPDVVQTKVLECLDLQSLARLRMATRSLSKQNLFKAVAVFHGTLLGQVKQTLETTNGVLSDEHHRFLQDMHSLIHTCLHPPLEHRVVREEQWCQKSFERRVALRKATDEDRRWIMKRAVRGDNVDQEKYEGLFRHGSLTLGTFKRWNTTGNVPSNLDAVHPGGVLCDAVNALHYAIMNRNVPFCRHLVLRCGMNPETTFTRHVWVELHVTPLQYAVYLGHRAMVQCLVQECGVNVNTVVAGRLRIFPPGASPLDIALHCNGTAPNRAKILVILKDAGARHTAMENMRYF